MARRRLAAALSAALLLPACGARAFRLPSDPGTPLPDARGLHAEATRACSRVTSFSAELALSGHVGRQRLRGRVLAALASPDSIRLEGVAPFGAPAFILAARGSDATLLLPRDNGVVRGRQADEILGSLTGVPLPPADLLAIMSGCVMSQPVVEGGSLHAHGWASLRLDGGVMYLRRGAAGWQVEAGRIPGWQVEYPAASGSFPRVVRLRSLPSGRDGAAVDLRADITQLETNAAIPSDAFVVNVPPSAVPVSLEELRDAGPLRGASQ